MIYWDGWRSNMCQCKWLNTLMCDLTRIHRYLRPATSKYPLIILENKPSYFWMSKKCKNIDRAPTDVRARTFFFTFDVQIYYCDRDCGGFFMAVFSDQSHLPKLLICWPLPCHLFWLTWTWYFSTYLNLFLYLDYNLYTFMIYSKPMSHCLLCGNDIMRWCIIFRKKDIFSPSLRRSLNFGHQMVCKVICAEAESDENCNWWSPPSSSSQNSCNKIISKGSTQYCGTCICLHYSCRINENSAKNEMNENCNWSSFVSFPPSLCPE